MSNLTELKEWKELVRHHQDIANYHMRDWFLADQARFPRFTLQTGDIFLDYSRNRINDQTISLLTNLAQSVDLHGKISLLMAGKLINTSENRPALHTALRNLQQTPILVNDQNVTIDVAATLQKMSDFSARIHAKQWLGSTGKPIDHIVNVGIGGSHLGPKMCIDALKEFRTPNIGIDFISSVDDTHLREVLQRINPETTLFIISSKSFSTLETLTNANTIVAWLKQTLNRNDVSKHLVAATAAPEKAIAFGIPGEHIFTLWEWVGGRYSVWSAIGLPLMLLIGSQQFNEFLSGANEMDTHFKTAPFEQNMPVILALLGIWYTNFFGTTAQAIVPYSHRLRQLIPYLQQAEMESNGKGVNIHGKPLDYATVPVLFGEEGCDGQHAYHQLLHQGQNFIPVDFILTQIAHNNANNHQDILFASCLSQAQALMQGKTRDEAYQDLIAANYSKENADQLAYHQAIPGNRPSNILLLKRISPKNLGALIALYEHKIFVQGVIWNINSFDQWGVELGKQLLPSILKRIQQQEISSNTDPATQGLINFAKGLNNKS